MNYYVDWFTIEQICYLAITLFGYLVQENNDDYTYSVIIDNYDTCWYVLTCFFYFYENAKSTKCISVSCRAISDCDGSVLLFSYFLNGYLQCDSNWYIGTTEN